MENIIKKYFAKIGKKGGSVKSERKKHASKNNGRLGGRGKKRTSEVFEKIVEIE